MSLENLAGPRILAHLQSSQTSMLEAIDSLVRHESHSHDKPALDAIARLLARRFADLGGLATIVPSTSGGDHVHIRFGSAGSAHPPALVLGHFDTVWPAGTLARMPIRRNDARLSGPGIFDMKANLVIIEFALRACRQTGRDRLRPVEVLLTSDEEIGSPTSRRLIEQTAQGAAYVLVPEPPMADGSLKTARKGVGQFTLEVTGRAAHAGVEPEKGVSAVVELAHQILGLHALANPAAGTTLNIGLVTGGMAPNVVPAAARAVIDVRAATLAEARRVEASLSGLAPVVPGARLKLTGGFNRPPMERTPAIAALFQRARAIGTTIGLELTEGATGGGSDGNFTAALGVPTLDGLGVRGGGAHADDEHIRLDDLAPRTALLAALLLEL